MSEATRIRRSCVYLLRDDCGAVRYVGKGNPDRPRLSGLAKGLHPEVVVDNLNDHQAREVESRLIHLIGPERLENTKVMSWSRRGREVYEVTTEGCREVSSLPYSYPTPRKYRG